MSSHPAARLTDPIQHSSALGGLLTGLLVGAALGVAAILIAGTGGLAAFAIVGGLAAAGAGIGEVIGTMSFAMVTTGVVGMGSGNVLINMLPAARAHVDFVLCSDHPTVPVLAQGSFTVLINGMPAARRGELATCSAKIAAGSPNVLIGGDTVTTDLITPEVPPLLHSAILVVGLGSAVVLFGPVAAIVGLAGGMAGGYAGGLIAEWAFDHPDAQKWGMLGGSLVGAWFGVKGGLWASGKAIPTPTTASAAFFRNGLGTARSLEYQPSSGANLVGKPGQTTTILGNFSRDMTNVVDEFGNVKNTEFGPRPGDFQVLNAPDEFFRSPEQFWQDYNRPWLDQSIKRGDNIILATEPTDAVLFRATETGEILPSGFGREYRYLLDHGYTYDPASMTMIKP